MGRRELRRNGGIIWTQTTAKMQGADLPILSEWQVLHNFEAEAKEVQIL